MRFAKWQDGKYTRNLVDAGYRLTTNLLGAVIIVCTKTSKETHFLIILETQFLIFQETTTSTWSWCAGQRPPAQRWGEYLFFEYYSNPPQSLPKFLQLAHKHTETRTLKRTNTQKDKPLRILIRFTTTRKLIASCGFWREVLLRRGFDRCGGGGGGGDDEGNWYERDLDISMDFGAGIFKVEPMSKNCRGTIDANIWCITWKNL